MRARSASWLLILGFVTGLAGVISADDLPDLQVHHGTSDDVVPDEEARRLIDVMDALGRPESEFEHYLYPGGEHNPLTLSGSLGRTLDFLQRLR